MVKIAKLIGGAGTGKTTELLRLLAQLLHKGYDPISEIGFCSFTRAARREAMDRVVDELGVRQSDIERHGHFRTLHSICYRATQVGKALLAGDSDSRDWFKSEMECTDPIGRDEGDSLTQSSDADSDESVAMGLWDAARQRLVSLYDVHAEYERSSGAPKTFERVKSWVERYEKQKWLTDRFDFTDVLLRFAGLRADVDGYVEMDPQGEPPPCRVWFLDEWQDSSELMNRVALRLINHWSTEFVYVAGDPFQAIYGFSGSNPAIFRRMRADKERIMPQSYRCAPEIMRLGEQCLRQASDYWDRGIAPASHAGGVGRTVFEAAPWEIDSRDEWLVIARTNYQVRGWQDSLTKAGVVWAPTRGSGGFEAPAKREGYIALRWIAEGSLVSLSQWRRAIALITAKGWLEHGAKTRVTNMKEDAEKRYWPRELLELGATEQLLEAITSGKWGAFITDDKYLTWKKALDTFGETIVSKPRVKVGTIHSVKGWGADNVLLDCGSTRRIDRAVEASSTQFDEECRVAYVGCTRAKKQLVLAIRNARDPRLLVPAI